MAKTIKELDPIPEGADIADYDILVDDRTNADPSNSSGIAPATFFKGDKGDTGPQGATGATGAQGAKGDKGDTGPAGGIQSIVAGANVSVDNTDPANPVVNSTGASPPLMLSVNLSTSQFVPLSSFTKISFYSADPAWDDYNKRFIAPSSGVYLFILKVRIEDSSSTPSFGYGVHDTVADNPHFAWRSPVASGRNSFLSTRIMALSSGDPVYPIVFSDGELHIITAGTSMDVVRIS